MRGAKSELIFDTSGLNALADDPSSLAILKSLGLGFIVRLSETSLAEVAATQDPTRRKLLLDVCRHIAYAGECVRPYSWIIEQLTKAHARGGARFNWRDLSVRGPELEEELAHGQFLGRDEIAEEILKDFRAQGKRFEAVYKKARPAFDKLFEPADAERPTVSGLIAALKIPGGALWEQGAGMYRRGCGQEIEEAGIRQFVAACPPFHAVLLSLCIAQFNWCIKDIKAQSLYPAGRLDLFSAVYLPLSDRFVTKDPGQYKALKVVAQEANLTVEVSTYAEFRQSFLIGAEAVARPNPGPISLPGGSL
jgi:hypothetical protein